MSWVDTGVVIAVIIFFVAVIYKAMPEPINLVLGGIGRMFGFVGEKTVGAASGAGEIVTYG
jgi:hypothetical protein